MPRKPAGRRVVAEPAVDVVEVAADEHRRLVLHALERVRIEELLELDPALEAREPEVHVEHVDGAIDIAGLWALVMAHADHAVERAALLLEPDRQIDVRGLDDRIATEDRVAVAPPPRTSTFGNHDR